MTPPPSVCLSEIPWTVKTDKFHPQKPRLHEDEKRRFPGQRLSPRHFAFQGINVNIWRGPGSPAIRRVCLQLQSIWCLFNLPAGVCWVYLGCLRDSIELVGVDRVSHLLRQHHGFGLLSLQSGPAHRDLQLAETNAGLVHLTEVLRLRAKPAVRAGRQKQRKARTLQTFSLVMLSLLPMISASRSRLLEEDSMAVKQSRAWGGKTTHPSERSWRKKDCFTQRTNPVSEEYFRIKDTHWGEWTIYFNTK